MGIGNASVVFVELRIGGSGALCSWKLGYVMIEGVGWFLDLIIVCF